jgi:hypothetical protein
LAQVQNEPLDRKPPQKSGLRHQIEVNTIFFPLVLWKLRNVDDVGNLDLIAIIEVTNILSPMVSINQRYRPPALFIFIK